MPLCGGLLCCAEAEPPFYREITLDTTLSQIFYAKSTIEMGLSEFEILDTENRPLVAAAAQIESLCTDEIPVMFLPSFNAVFIGI